MPSALLPWVAGRTAEAGFLLWFPGLRGVQCEGTRTHLLSVLLPQERTAEGQPLLAAVFMRPAGAISGRGPRTAFTFAVRWPGVAALPAPCGAGHGLTSPLGASATLKRAVPSERGLSGGWDQRGSWRGRAQ